jgi:hypothetical protein
MKINDQAWLVCIEPTTRPIFCSTWSAWLKSKPFIRPIDWLGQPPKCSNSSKASLLKKRDGLKGFGLVSHSAKHEFQAFIRRLSLNLNHILYLKSTCYLRLDHFFNKNKNALFNFVLLDLFWPNKIH